MSNGERHTLHIGSRSSLGILQSWHRRVVETWIIRFYICVCCCLHIICVAFCVKSKSNVNYLIDTRSSAPFFLLFHFTISIDTAGCRFGCVTLNCNEQRAKMLSKKLRACKNAGRYECECLVTSMCVCLCVHHLNVEMISNLSMMSMMLS